MFLKRLIALGILVLTLFLGFFLVGSQPGGKSHLGIDFKDKPFTLGLDLSGGTHLIYDVDTTLVKENKEDALNVLRDVIERRVNLFGVSEPIVQISHGLSGEDRLLIDLPGVTDVGEAIKMIGETPLLEFKTENPDFDATTLTEEELADPNTINRAYIETDLTGRYLENASLVFDQTTREAIVSIQFDSEGAEIFEKITSENVNKTIAIYLDGALISNPVVNEAISGGQATISGNFTPDEAKQLVGRLNSGALPVPVTLVSTETIGATLGAEAIVSGIKAAIIGFSIVALFLLAWYRLPGIVAILSLGAYMIITLVLYKLIPVTLSVSGIAGLIISIGMAVDANILIFERAREERGFGQSAKDAMSSGFSRAWFSIRDGNTAAIIVAIILFWFGTPLIKGFAVTLGLGVVVSLISAVTITKALLLALPSLENSKVGKILYSSGFSK